MGALFLHPVGGGGPLLPRRERISVRGAARDPASRIARKLSLGYAQPAAEPTEVWLCQCRGAESSGLPQPHLGGIGMNILILGLSSIAQRRVLPALHALGVERIDIATRKAVDAAVRRGWTHGQIFENYQAGLNGSDAPLVYVSLVNSEHESWIEASLRAGRHV